MAISRDQVDEIKSRVSIIDVAAERVNLSRHGSTMSCCCPFHQEKTPSCVLYEKTNSFYCFGCGTSGDVISFIRGTDNLSYVEAVQQLAQRAGITIDAKVHSSISVSRSSEIVFVRATERRHVTSSVRLHRTMKAVSGELIC